MIICEEKNNITSCGNMQSSGFTILASSKAFQILSSNIYTHKIRAIIREISTNAYDAHIDAKNDEPFDVHIPTHLETWFSVRDYGTGISHEKMMSLYTQFFKSTRNESNDFCGALGIGRMAPLCISDSFTVESFYNNEKRIYCVFKDENGIPAISLLNVSSTDEPNGLKVYIDVDQYSVSKFRDEAEYVYSFFDKLPNINIPSIAESINNKKKYTIDTPEFKANFSYGNQYAVMGNVAYNIPNEYCEDLNIDFCLYFNIGELSFDPGRENLSMDKKTIAAIKEKISLVKNNMKSYIEDIIESKTTKFEKALCLQNILKGHCVRNILGYTYVDKLSEKHALKDTKTSFTIYESSRGRVSSYQTTNASHLNLNIKLFKNIKGCSGRIKNYVRDTNSKVAVFTDDQMVEAGIESQFVNDPFSLPKPERNKGVTVKKGDVYEYANSSSKKTAWTECTLANIPQGQKVYVEIFNNDIMNYAKFRNNFYGLRRLMLNSFMNGVELFGVKSKLAHSKEFLNDKTWISLKDYVKNTIDDLKKLNPNRIENSSYRSNLICRLASLLPDTFTEFKDFATNVELCKNINQDAIRFIECYDESNESKNNIIDTIEEKILEKYPLLSLVTDGSCSSDSTISELAKYIQLVS